MKTKTRDLSTCLKRRLWIVGVCLTTFSFLSVSVAYAVSDNQTVQQQKKGMVIKGKVLGTDGEPIIGASVLVKGSTTGVVTDLDGNYTLSNVSKGAILEFSYVGYVKLTKAVGNETTINAILYEDSQMLEGVEVVAFGTQKKESVIGAISTVKVAELKTPSSNLTNALAGRIAGVISYQRTGEPGVDDASFFVRGVTTFGYKKDPLILIDGIELTSTDLARLQPDDIASFSIMKDATATALYGARGANGVILVTTKGADKDRVSVSYSGYYQSKWAAKTPEPMSAQDYVKHTWGYGTALGMGDQMASYFGLGEKYGNHYSEYANMDSHNWTDDMLRTASAQNHNVTINGGSEKTKISFSVNYLNDDGIKIKSGYERFSTNLKLKQELAKGLSFELDARYVSTNVEGKDEARSGRGSLLSSAYQYRPIDTPLGNGDDALFQMGSKNIEVGANPVGLTNAITDLTNRQNIRANAALNWEIIKGLKARTEFAIGHGWSEGKYYDDGSASSVLLLLLIILLEDINMLS